MSTVSDARILTRPRIYNKTMAREYYSALRRAGRLSGSISSCVARWSERDTRRKRSDGVYGRVGIRHIPLGEVTSREAMERARAEYPRRKRWSGTQASRTSGIRVDTGRYSSRCTWTKNDYVVCVESWGACTPHHMLCVVDGRRYRYAAPRGWRFGLDRLGLFVERSKSTSHLRRYHFDSDEAIDFRRLMESARAHDATQVIAERAKRQEAKLRKRDLERLKAVGVWVCFADSIRSGNCAAGTRSFARIAGLDTKQYYPVEVLRKLMSGGRFGSHVDQIQRAIVQAESRTLADLNRGYCSL